MARKIDDGTNVEVSGSIRKHELTLTKRLGRGNTQEEIIVGRLTADEKFKKSDVVEVTFGPRTRITLTRHTPPKRPVYFTGVIGGEDVLPSYLSQASQEFAATVFNRLLQFAQEASPAAPTAPKSRVRRRPA